MKIVVGVLLAVLVLFSALVGGGMLLGLLGRQDQLTPTLIVAALAGAAAAEAARWITPRPYLGRVIALSCAGVGGVLFFTQLAHWQEHASLAWGSVMLDAAVLLGLFGSWARWSQEADAAARKGG
jgi:hypothetical protein